MGLLRFPQVGRRCGRRDLGAGFLQAVDDGVLAGGKEDSFCLFGLEEKGLGLMDSVEWEAVEGMRKERGIES